MARGRAVARGIRRHGGAGDGCRSGFSDCHDPPLCRHRRQANPARRSDHRRYRRREFCDLRAVPRDLFAWDDVADRVPQLEYGRRSSPGQQQHGLAAGLCRRGGLAGSGCRDGCRSGHAGRASRRSPLLPSRLRGDRRGLPGGGSAFGGQAFARDRRRTRCAARNGCCCVAIPG